MEGGEEKGRWVRVWECLYASARQQERKKKNLHIHIFIADLHVTEKIEREILQSRDPNFDLIIICFCVPKKIPFRR